MKPGFSDFIYVKISHHLVVVADGFDIAIMMQLTDNINHYIHCQVGIFNHRKGCFSVYKAKQYLAFVVADTVPWAQIAATARTAAGPLLRDVQLFDRYVGQGVESGQKSLAMGLILQDNSRTLTDADVAQVVAQVVAAIGDAHGAKVRG